MTLVRILAVVNTDKNLLPCVCRCVSTRYYSNYSTRTYLWISYIEFYIPSTDYSIERVLGKVQLDKSTNRKNGPFLQK